MEKNVREFRLDSDFSSSIQFFPGTHRLSSMQQLLEADKIS